MTAFCLAPWLGGGMLYTFFTMNPGDFCTYRLAEAIDTPSLLAIPRVFVYIALAAWLLAAAGLAGELLRAARRRDVSRTARKI